MQEDTSLIFVLKVICLLCVTQTAASLMELSTIPILANDVANRIAPFH